MINRNGAALLPASLRSCRKDLEAVWNSFQGFELIVVDNGSTDDSLKIIDAGLSGAPFPWRIVSEPVAGVNSARLAGIHHAHGELIVFTDSDLEFESGWLNAYLSAAAKHPQVGVFAGRVKIGRIDGEIPTWLDLDGPYRRPSIAVQLDLGDESAVYPIGCPEGGPVGPNMAIRRSVFQGHGPFDLRFGLRPGSMVPGAEAEYMDRLARAGLSFVYVPDAIVLHPLLTNQITKQYFLKRLHGIGRVVGRLHHVRGTKCKRLFGMTLYVFRQLVGQGCRYLSSFVRGGPQRRFYYRGELAILFGHLHEDLAVYWRTQPDDAIDDCHSTSGRMATTALERKGDVRAETALAAPYAPDRIR